MISSDLFRHQQRWHYLCICYLASGQQQSAILGHGIEFNNRLLQAFNASTPLDAYPQSSKELRQYGDAYVTQTREKDSCLVSHRLWFLSPPPALIFSPKSMASQQQASALLPSPHLQTDSQSPQLAAVGPQYTAQVPAANHLAAAAPQPRLAQMFQAQAKAASGQKRLRDRSLGKGSNQGRRRGGSCVGKTCQACSVIEGKPVQSTRAHQNTCIYCTKYVVKSKGNN